MNYKKYLTIIQLSILILAVGIGYFYYSKNKQLQKDLNISINNEKAYVNLNDSIENNNRLFQYKISQLNYYKDSIILKLKQVTKELKIKDKNLQQLQYISSTLSKKDTVIIKDTIFKEPNFKLDTLIGDKWISTNLHLEYPNKIILNNKCYSEKYIVFSNKKETINPPSKFFLFRWLQKKHIVVDIKVVEKNPYEINKEQRFIEIIK